MGSVSDGHERPTQANAYAGLWQQRWELVRRLDAATDKPLIILSFVWIGLLIVDLTIGLSPFWLTVNNVIWGLFILDFVAGFLIAPQRLVYLRTRWLTALSLLLPALRIFRLVQLARWLRAARAVRSLSLLRVLTSLNRGLTAISQTFGHYGLGAVLLITLVVILVGAAGIFFLERPVADESPTPAGAGLASYGEALWWTAMMVTTVGADFTPRSLEGRILAWLLAVFGLGVFGYVAGTIASIFVRRLTPAAAAPTEHERSELAALRAEIAALRAEVAAWRPPPVDD